jgi:hypothetical protein
LRVIYSSIQKDIRDASEFEAVSEKESTHLLSICKLRNLNEPWIKMRLIISFSGMGKMSDTISVGICRSRKRKMRRSNRYGI